MLVPIAQDIILTAEAASLVLNITMLLMLLLINTMNIKSILFKCVKFKTFFTAPPGGFPPGMPPGGPGYGGTVCFLLSNMLRWYHIVPLS